jgi:sodium transport system ATP-binding protein
MIEFASLSKLYGDFEAVSSLSLNVRSSEVYALLGANGAGKTTALRCLVGLLTPSSGSVLVDGIDVCRDPMGVRRRVGFLSASMGLYARLTPIELLRYFGELHDCDPKWLEVRIRDLVADFDITPFANRYCGTLSTGQRQRVSIARSVVHDPSALVLDEPTLGLDVISSQLILEFIQKSKDRGRAVLFSTHQMSEVELVADRVGVVVDGRLVSEGTIDEINERTGEDNLIRSFVALARGVEVVG